MMVCWESVKENHMMMPLWHQYLPSDDTIVFWDSHLYYGDSETKIKPITLSTLGFPKPLMVSLQMAAGGGEKNTLYSICCIKSSLLAVWKKVNIAAIKIHIWAEHLVFAECSYLNFVSGGLKPFRNFSIYRAASLGGASGNRRLHHPQRHLPLTGRESPGGWHIQKSILSKRETRMENSWYFMFATNLFFPLK